MKVIRVWHYEGDTFLMIHPQYHFYTTRSTNKELGLNNGKHNAIYNACLQNSMGCFFIPMIN
jgi:hypothetical protein